jgi:hypothetical protein
VPDQSARPGFKMMLVLDAIEESRAEEMARLKTKEMPPEI